MSETIVVVSGAGEQGPAGPPSLAVGAVVVGRGQLVVGNAAGTPVALSPTGSTGKFLKGGTDPAWTAIAAADVTNLTTDLAAKAPLASPTFTGTVTAAAVTATGNVTLGDADTDVIVTQGLQKTTGANPTVTYGTGAGTGPSTGSIEGDTSGCRIVFTTGTSPAAAGANIFTLNFPTTRADTNYRVVIQGCSRQAAIDNFYPFDSGRTTGGIGIAAEATLSASTEYRLYIWIIGH